MDFQQAQQDVLHWMQSFVEQPHPALAGRAPCPYARQARKQGELEEKQQSFNQFIGGNIQHALFLDWPDNF